MRHPLSKITGEYKNFIGIVPIMKKIISFSGMMIGSYLGWWLGEKVGFMTAFMVSTIGAGVGLYLAQRWAKKFME